MPLDIIGAGWGRTGTLSLKEALEELGYPCYHMKEVIDGDFNKVYLWHEAHKKGDLEDWGAMFDSGHSTTGGAYRATVDFPGCSFYKELMAAYPDAKVILTERDPEKWYQSLVNTVGRRFTIMGKQPWYMKRLGPGAKWNTFRNMLADLIFQGDLQGKMYDDPEGVKKLFVDHNEEVKRTVPADKLLVFEVSQGWEPLCRFLDVPVPDKPFPNTNDTASWTTLNDQLERNINRVRLMVNTATAVAVAGLVALLASRQANKK
eukprot:jgi/Chrzof1/5135/Cz15g12210.t1